MKKQLSHFNMHVKDMDKAVAFYRDVMGFDVEYQTDEWSELRLNDKVELSLQQTSSPGSGIGFAVDNCEEATKLMEERGATIDTRCDTERVPGVILTQFKDADGNTLWMSERVKK
jgi:predicted enzyme related to lactoylglutathione lyase